MRGDFRVGDWIVHPSLNALERDGKTVHLEPKVMQVLLTLASEPSEVFTRETVQRQVWPDVVVGEDVLIRAIGKIRRAFNNDSVIETVPKVGYRLVAPVVRESDGIATEIREPLESFAPLLTDEAAHVDATPVAPSLPTHPIPDPIKVPASRRPVIWLVAFAAVFLVAFATFAIISRVYRGHSTQTSAYVTRPFTTDPDLRSRPAFLPTANRLLTSGARTGRATARSI